MPSAKISKADANYTDKSPKRPHRCANCQMFTKPNKCSLVKGEIYPEGYCRYWEPKV